MVEIYFFLVNAIIYKYEAHRLAPSRRTNLREKRSLVVVHGEPKRGENVKRLFFGLDGTKLLLWHQE